VYTVDEYDRVVEFDGAPPFLVGAPCPMVLAGDHRLHLAYYAHEVPGDWDGTFVHVVGEESTGRQVVLVTFHHPYAHLFGPPNDEALSGHPLASRGLSPYGMFVVHESSWIRRLERMNSVHPQHKPERFVRYQHYIFTFHDTTFECVAEGTSVSEHTGSVAEIMRGVAEGIVSGKPLV
jgi:hypothetical protein